MIPSTESTKEQDTMATQSASSSVDIIERRLKVPDFDSCIRPSLLLGIAWAVVVATFSGETEISVEYLDVQASALPTRAVLQLDPTVSLRGIYAQLQRALDKQRSTLASAAIDVPQHDLEISSAGARLPRALITADMTGLAKKFAEGSGYDVVFCLSETSERGVLNLMATGQDLIIHGTSTLLDRMEIPITHFAADEDIKFGNMNLLCPVDVLKLASWNEEMPPALDKCIHNLIEQQVKLRPQSEAVCAWDGSFTYEELDRRARALATRLVAAGAGPGSFVPVMFEKSKWQVVSLLAVLKTGAAFVALEHSIPDGRINIMLRQFEALPAILASRYQEARFPRFGHNVIVVDDGSTNLELPGMLFPGEGDVPAIQLTSPAYAIFTSGTTGTPKGAVIEHRQLSTSIQALNDRIGAGPDMRKFQMTAYNFDLSITETFCPLLCGGCLTVPSEWARFNDLAHAFNSLNSNFSSFSPSFLATLSEKELPNMRTILLAGERISADLSDYWTQHGRRVVHMYGPTECTVGCTFLDASVETHYDGFLGDAYGSRIWVIDPEDPEKLVPIGAPGELLVEGPIVGSHYLGDQKKTKASFIDTPSWFSAVCNRQPSRFYRTGDLGRVTPEGRFEIIGRKDTQIKIRGLRVEVEEIENQIIAAAAETKFGVAVEVRNPDGIPGQEVLAAFLQLNFSAGTQQDTSLEVLWEDLRDGSDFSLLTDFIKLKIQDVLPSYMIPSIFIPVSALPYVNSYKLNRRALRSLVNSISMLEYQDAISGKARRSADQTLTLNERVLRDLLATTLQKDPTSIDVHDDFFLIGGDSLKAMALISEARRKGMLLTVASLYEARTVKNLSPMVGQSVGDQQDVAPFSLIEKADIQSLCQLASKQCATGIENIQDILPLNDMQQFFLRPTIEDRRSWVTPVVFDLPRGIDPTKFQRAWEQLMARHDINRTRFIRTDKGFLQVVLKNEKTMWRFGTNEDELLEALKETNMSFGRPSHSYGLLRGPDQIPTRLIWLVNHSLSDRIQDDHVAQELSLLYQGQVKALPKRPSFQCALKHVLRGNRKASNAFWRDQMDGARFGPMFELDIAALEPFANTQIFVRASVEQAAQKTIHRENSVALTALAVALSQAVGVEDIPFFLLHAGRDPSLAGSEDVMGPMLQRVPLRIRAGSNRDVATVLASVDSKLGECLNHPLIDENDFRNISTETAAHASNAIMINIQPPFSAFLLDSHAIFSPGYDANHGMGYRCYPFAMNVTFEGTTAVVKVMWKKKTIRPEVIERLQNGLADAFSSMEKMASVVDNH